MEHIKNLVIKFIMCTVMLLVVLGLFFGVSFTNILWTSVILTVVSYLLGDILILPKGGNLIATVSDLVLAFLAVWVVGMYLYDPDVNLIPASIVSAIVIAVGEWFFHNYVKKQIREDKPAS